MWEDVKFGGSVILGIVTIIYVLCISASYIKAVSVGAAAQQLRIDVRKVSKQYGEDVYGEAAKLNKLIMSQRALNATVLGIAISDRWDDIELIELGDKK